jgi:hypothetical protein
VAEQPYKETEDGTVLVPLKLAHPMAKVYAERARVDGPLRDHKVGDTVWVPREHGNALIEAGMVQVDPVDTEGRQRALLLNRRNAPLVGEELAAVAAPADKQQDAADAPSAETGTRAAKTK